jgi:putative hydrolase of HD superfamily
MLKVFKLSLFHDVVEIDAGDTFVYSNIDSQEISRNERKAAERIYGLLPADQAAELMSIWNEYEDAISPESKFARAIDRFMPILHNYKTKGLQWQKLNVTSDMVLQKNNRIEQGSKELWEYINMIVKDAVEKGYLQK